MSRSRLGLLVIAGLLSFAAASPPWFFHRGLALVALVLRAFFGAICHQRPERSLWFYGYPCAVCSRCLGIYVGLLVGACLALRRDLSQRLLLFFFCLNGLDVVLEFSGVHGNWLAVRLVLGLCLGAAASAVLVSHAQQTTQPL